MNLPGAGGAVFCPAGADEDARAADFAAAEFFRAENGLFQLWLSRQHGAAKPPAKQTSGDVLRTDAVQQQTLAIKEIAAVLCKAAHAAELPRRQTKEWCCTIKVDIENSKGQYIEKDKQEATKDGSESTKIQHGI